MALGDCISPPCVSPLDFDSALVNLFAINRNGCMSLKIHLDIGSALTDPCAEEMTLQELILSSMVDDGAGGYALRFINVTGSPDCYPCAGYDDFESLLKSLFAKEGDCYGIKYTGVSLSCEGTTAISNCAGPVTVEQAIRMAIGHDDTNGNYLLMNQLTGTCTTVPECGMALSIDTIFQNLVVSIDGECYGAMNFNAVDNRVSFTDAVECGKYLSAEDAFRDALSVISVRCGYGLNVYIIDLPT